MVGKYDIEVYNNRVHYFLTVQRNITVIQGNSATGKTELIRLINEFNVNGNSSGITVKCDVKCKVLNTEDWDIRLSAMNGCVIFIDESANFLNTKKFAEMVRGSDNYFVIVTRDDLAQLPYSVEEIYGLKTVTDSTKYKSYKKIYNEMYKLYSLNPAERLVPSKVITEDSNSGFECFDMIYPGKCVSSEGKSNIYQMIRSEKTESVLVIVDGAAFGPEMSRIYRYLNSIDSLCVLYAPESFEYIILKSGIVSVPKAILEETYEFADSSKFISWEEFFTDYLVNITHDTVFQYSKSRLKESYRTSGVIQKITETLPEQIRPVDQTDDQ